eukprot:509507_1
MELLNKIKQANNDLDKECMVRIENKLNEMVSNILCCEKIFFNDINNSKIKIEMQQNHNNIKQEFFGSTSILNSHIKLIEDIGQKYIKVIRVLFNEKIKKSYAFYNSFQESKMNNTDIIKEEIIANEDNSFQENEIDNNDNDIIIK